MAIIRANKTSDYTVMSNRHLRDKNLSLKAKGLLSVVLALPENWDYSISGLVAICKESETAVKSSIKELKDNGYMVVSKERGNNGQFEYVYTFLEIPEVENPEVENVGQLNTKESITEELNTKVLNTENINANPRKKTSPTYYPDELLNQAFLDFIEMRKKLKKPMTNRAIELLQKKLKELSTLPLSESMDNDLAIKILEQSILHDWQSIYPLKDNTSKQGQNVYDEWRNA